MNIIAVVLVYLILKRFSISFTTNELFIKRAFRSRSVRYATQTEVSDHLNCNFQTKEPFLVIHEKPLNKKTAGYSTEIMFRRCPIKKR